VCDCVLPPGDNPIAVNKMMMMIIMIIIIIIIIMPLHVTVRKAPTSGLHVIFA
jgi:hypothetical protein